MGQAKNEDILEWELNQYLKKKDFSEEARKMKKLLKAENEKRLLENNTQIAAIELIHHCEFKSQEDSISFKDALINYMKKCRKVLGACGVLWSRDSDLKEIAKKYQVQLPETFSIVVNKCSVRAAFGQGVPFQVIYD